MADKSRFSSLPAELRYKIIEELLLPHKQFNVCTELIPRPLRMGSGKRIRYRTALPIAIFQVNRETREDALSILLNKKAVKADLRYCTRGFVTQIKNLPPSELLSALNYGVSTANLGDLCGTDIQGLRSIFPNLEHLAFDHLGERTPYLRTQQRRTDGFSRNKPLIPFMRGDFDAEFLSVVRQDLIDVLKNTSGGLLGCKLDVPFRFSLPYSAPGDHTQTRSCLPGSVLVYNTTHHELETVIAKKYFSSFKVNNSGSRDVYQPSTTRITINEKTSKSLQNAFVSNNITGIDCTFYESIEVSHSPHGCGTALIESFDAWLNDNYGYD